MTVDVVIPVYGNWPTVARLVQLIEEEPGVAGVIIVDDASPVPPPSELGSPRVRVVRRVRNGGFAAAVNTGLRHCTADAVAVLNSDLVITGGDVLALASTAKELQAIVGPRTLRDGEVAPTARRWQTIPRMLAEFTVPLRAFPAVDRQLRDLDFDALEEERSSVDWLVGSCLVFPLSVWRTVGPFDERYHMNSEELDWQRRAAAAGIPRVFVGSVIAEHTGGGSSGGAGQQFAAIWRARWLDLRMAHGRSVECGVRLATLMLAILQTPFIVTRAMMIRDPGWGLRVAARHLGAPFRRVPAPSRRAVGPGFGNARAHRPRLKRDDL